MRTTVAALALAASCLTTGTWLSAQAQPEPPATNPLSGNADAVQAGMGLFKIGRAHV